MDSNFINCLDMGPLAEDEEDAFADAGYQTGPSSGTLKGFGIEPHL